MNLASCGNGTATKTPHRTAHSRALRASPRSDKLTSLVAPPRTEAGATSCILIQRAGALVAVRDRVVPVENAQRLYHAVGSKDKTIKIFTSEDGGAEHAYVDNGQVAIDFVAGWLADRV